VPFVLGVMRYGLLVDQGHGEEPERLLLKDRQLQLLVLAWLVLILIGVVA
jgi:decaprenyl-phosphate phosphoribosyltransferase